MVITAKPFDQMSLAELQRERTQWDRLIRHLLAGDPVTLRTAEDCRLGCDAMIARRTGDGVAA